MLQYRHVIHHANRLFIWENIYAYDMDFHIHMAKHPNRSWGIILQQAWSMRLQDRIDLIRTGSHGGSSREFNNDGHQNTMNQGGRKKKICWVYNSGNCTYGFGCKFDHRCGVCGKLGHGAHICRKVKQFSHSNG